jgi:hypothetical protein
VTATAVDAHGGGGEPSHSGPVEGRLGRTGDLPEIGPAKSRALGTPAFAPPIHGVDKNRRRHRPGRAGPKWRSGPPRRPAEGVAKMSGGGRAGPPAGRPEKEGPGKKAPWARPGPARDQAGRPGRRGRGVSFPRSRPAAERPKPRRPPPPRAGRPEHPPPPGPAPPPPPNPDPRRGRRGRREGQELPTGGGWRWRHSADFRGPSSGDMRAAACARLRPACRRKPAAAPPATTAAASTRQRRRRR